MASIEDGRSSVQVQVKGTDRTLGAVRVRVRVRLQEHQTRGGSPNFAVLLPRLTRTGCDA